MGRVAQKTAVVYCRTSTGGQKDAKTIDAQIEACRRIVDRHGVRLLAYGPKGDGWIKDDGVSGSLLEGRAFARLIDDLQARGVRVDYLVVYSMSRLARLDKSSKDMAKLVESAQDKARIMAVLLGAGVKVLDDQGENDPSSVMFDIKESLSTEEYRLIRKRTMDGKARVLANGAWATGGRVPYGYRRVFVNGADKKQGTTPAEHPEDGRRFRQLMHWYIAGGVTHAARKAMQASWPSPRGSKTWFASSVQQILNNLRAYLGERTLSIDGQPYDIKYPALIDAKMYAAIVRRKKERTLKHRTTLLATGYADCACGRHIHGHRSGTARPFYTHCRGRCGSMREDEFSEKLWELAVARLVQIKEHERIVSGGTDPYGPQLEAAKGRLANLQEQIDRIVGLYAEGIIDRAALNKNNEKLRQQKATLQAEVDQLDRRREQHKQRKLGEESVHARVQGVLRRLRKGRVPIDGKRRVLADLLQGERVIVTWKNAKMPYVTITLPAFGQLPPITVRIDRDVTAQLHGVSRDVMNDYYEVEEIVENVEIQNQGRGS